MATHGEPLVRSSLPLLLVPILFLALAPLAADYAIHHPDEQYYTTAAMRMNADGDYLTPRDEDGSARFHKPPLAYWLVAASYRLLGVTPFTSRLPFLLAGCAVLALTFHAARRLTGDGRVAAFALLALLSQPQMILASLRSMTDVVLTFGILLAAFGFLWLLIEEREPVAAPACAWAGLAVAFLAKGMLALVLLAYVGVFAVLEHKDRRVLRRLVHGPSAAVAGIVVAAWLTSSFARGGTGALRSFLADQMSGRFVVEPLRVVWMTPVLLLFYALCFLPWSAPAARLVGAGALGGREGRPALRTVRRFAVGWALVVAILFAGARELEEHYLLPAVPPLAILLGSILAEAEPERARAVLRQALVVTLAAVAAIGALALSVLVQVEAPATAVASLLAALAAIGVVGGLGARGRIVSPATAQALVVLLVFPLLHETMAPVALPGQQTQLARRLNELGVGDGRPVLFVGKRGTAGKLRVALAGHADVRRRDELNGLPIDGYAAVIAPAGEAERLRREGFRTHPGSHGLRPLDVVDLLEAAVAGRLRSFLERHREELVIGVRSGGGA